MKEVTLNTMVYHTPLFNANPSQDQSEATPVLADTDGIIDPTGSPYGWAKNLWDVMRDNDWAPEEVDTTVDGKAYLDVLNDVERDGFDLAIAALIFNDSAQTRNLAANMSAFITDGNILSCLARQTYEEALHSHSYDVLLKDVSPNRDEIYSMYKTDDKLRERDQFLDRMYGELAYAPQDGVDMLTFMKAVIANNLLEAIMFYAGFIFFWSLGQKMPGSAKMIAFIARDERTHVLLFRNIFVSILKAFPRLKDGDILKRNAVSMVDATVKQEIDWLKYITKGEIGVFNDTAIERYICGKGDSILKGLGFDPIYNLPESPLISFEKQYDDPNAVRTNFFEGRPSTYSSRRLPNSKYFNEGG